MRGGGLEGMLIGYLLLIGCVDKVCCLGSSDVLIECINRLLIGS